MSKLKTIAVVVFVLTISVLFSQLVSSEGEVPWFRISDIPYLQSVPEIAYNSANHQFMVVWEDWRGPNAGSDVFAQVVDSDGSLIGLNYSITIADDWQRSPKVAYAPSNNTFLVVWEEQKDSTINIYGRRLNSNGSLLGNEIFISMELDDQRNPDIAYNNATAQYLVVFDDTHTNPLEEDIYGKFVNADGTLSGNDFPISTSSRNQILPVVAYNSTDNQFLVVWQDNRNKISEFDYDLYARLINGNGSMVGPEFPISTSNVDHWYPQIAYDPHSNRYLVVWEHGDDIYGRLVNPDGTFTGSAFQLAASDGYLSDPAVAFDTNSNQFMIAWSDSVGWDDIYAQLLDSNGNLVGPEIDLASGMGDFFYPEIAFDSFNSQFLTVWRHQTCHDTMDCEDNDIDIYGAFYQAVPHFGHYLPLLIRNYSQPQIPTPTYTSEVPTPTDTPVTPEPTPSDTPIPPTPSDTPTESPGTWETILSEGFEGEFPGDWVLIDDYTTNGEFYWDDETCQANSGSWSAWAVGGGANGSALSCGDQYPYNIRSWMIYGPFSLADATDAEMTLSTWVKTQQTYDYLCWLASTDGIDFAGDCDSGVKGYWEDQYMDFSNVTDLGNLLGEPSVWIAMYFYSDSLTIYEEGGYVDDILVRKCTTGNCPSTMNQPTDTDLKENGIFPIHIIRDLP